MDWLHCADVHVHGCVFLMSMYVMSLFLLECVRQRPHFFNESFHCCCLWLDSSHLVSPASRTFQSECCVLRRGPCKATTSRQLLQVLLTFRHISLGGNYSPFGFCVAWPPVYQSLTRHKHKIVQILAKIVVFDWVLHCTQCQTGLLQEGLNNCSLCRWEFGCVYFTLSRLCSAVEWSFG